MVEPSLRRMLEASCAALALEEVATARLRLAFQSWIARTQTPAVHVAAIRSLQQAASAPVRPS